MVLDGDAGVVRPGQPQGVAAHHPLVAHQGVDQGVLKGVAHVQAARHVRRRDHDAEGSPPEVGIRLEDVASLPTELLPLGFGLGGRIVLRWKDWEGLPSSQNLEQMNG
jgi:hypothetical protein